MGEVPLYSTATKRPDRVSYARVALINHLSFPPPTSRYHRGTYASGSPIWRGVCSLFPPAPRTEATERQLETQRRAEGDTHPSPPRPDSSVRCRLLSPRPSSLTSRFTSPSLGSAPPLTHPPPPPAPELAETQSWLWQHPLIIVSHPEHIYVPRLPYTDDAIRRPSSNSAAPRVKSCAL